MSTKTRIKTWTVLFGIAGILVVSPTRAADNPALGIGEPNTPFSPPQGPRGCGDLPCDGCDDTGSPVFLSLGNAYLDFPDLTFGQSDPPFSLTRRYNSGEFYVGFFGRAFHSTLDMMSISTYKGNQPDDLVILRWPNGRRSQFTRQPDNSYSGPAGRFDSLVKTPTGFELETPEGLLHTFDAQTRLLTIVDRNGNTVSLDYDPQGRPVQINLPGGRTINVTYNASGFVDSISDFAGRSVGYDYDAAGFLTGFTDARGEPWTYQYQNQKLTAIIDPLGQTSTSLAYDAQGRLTQMVNEEGSFTYTYVNATTVRKRDNATGGETTYVFNAVGDVTSVTNAGGGVESRTYDAMQNLTSITRYGCTTSFTYNAQGQRLTRTDPSGAGTTSFTYNSLGLVETEVDPFGVVTRFEYDVDGNRTRVIEDDGGPLQRQTLLTYDAAGNVLTSLDPAGGLETYEYDASGRITAVTDPLGNRSTFAYDSLGNMTAATNAEMLTTQFEFEALGKMTRLVDPRGNDFIFQLDALGRLATIIDRNGNPTNYTYNAAGLETSVTNALGYSFLSRYDSAGRMTASVDPYANTTGFAYNASGFLTRSTNAAGAVRTFGVNARGNRTSLTDENNRTVSYQYNCRDQITRMTYPDATYDEVTYGLGARALTKRDRDGLITNYAYDRLGRLTLITYPNSATVALGYDAADRMTSVVNAAANMSLAYNAAGLLISETNNTLGTTVSYAYDRIGRRTSMTDPEGSTVTYEYDAADNLTLVSHPVMGTVTMGYDAEGQRTSVVHSDGTASDYQYDVAGRLTFVEHRRPDASVIASMEYSYDPAGNISGRTDGDGAHAYAYDPMHRLVSATHPNPGVNPNESYGYDPVGNRTTSHLSASYVYDQNHRLTEDAQYTYQYGAKGNLTRKTNKSTSAVTQYVYNTINQLVEVVHPDATSNSFAYDGMERRVSATLRDGTTVYFVYDGLQVLAEYDGMMALTSSYLTSLTEDDALLADLGAGPLHYLQDVQQSVVAMTDGTGAVVRSFKYDSFGRIVDQSGSSTDTYSYTGRDWDEEIGLYYYRARTYDPITGRFLQVDPLGFTMGPNNYVYVGNNPVNYIDPSGLIPTPGNWYGNCCGSDIRCEPGGDNCEKGPKDETDQCCNIHDRCLVGTGGATSCDEPSRQCHRELIQCWSSPPATNDPGWDSWRARNFGKPAFRAILAGCKAKDGWDKAKDTWDKAKDAARRAADAARRAADAARRAAETARDAARQWRRVRDFFRNPIPIPRLGF